MLHRDYILNNELHYAVLRLVQLRDASTRSGIDSVKYKGEELKSDERLSSMMLADCSVEEVKDMARSIGYERPKNVPGNASKIDIMVNGINCCLRCMTHTDRALVNHSSRRKFEAVCQYLNLPVEPLDTMVRDYWIARQLKTFNEDCYYYTTLNPFLDYKDYLRKILSFMAFKTLDYKKAGTPHFVVESVDQIIDFEDPCDENTWRRYTPDNYFDEIWQYLCFSMRDTKGMPSDSKLLRPENADILSWARCVEGRYKGALHIRIKKYEANKANGLFLEQFEVLHEEEIKEVKVNQGELDEYLVKLFLVDCRKKKIAVPIGDRFETVESVGSRHEEYGTPAVSLDWKKQTAKVVVYVCLKINAAKSGAFDKADVYVNHIGISVKSRRGAAPTIINQTSREKILRVMNAMGEPMAPLDHIVNRYWAFRLNGGTEDVNNHDHPDNPFCRDEQGSSNIGVLRPLINYFAFRGTGTRDSDSPARYILSVGLPDDTNTWIYYDESDFVERLWERFVFSIRSHGMPKTISEEAMPWVREINGKKKGLLNIRVKDDKKNDKTNKKGNHNSWM